MAMAIGRKDLDEAADEIAGLFNILTVRKGSLFEKIKSLPELLKVSGYLPKLKRGRGKCQQVVHRNPDLEYFPGIKMLAP